MRSYKQEDPHSAWCIILGVALAIAAVVGLVFLIVGLCKGKSEPLKSSGGNSKPGNTQTQGGGSTSSANGKSNYLLERIQIRNRGVNSFAKNEDTKTSCVVDPCDTGLQHNYKAQAASLGIYQWVGKAGRKLDSRGSPVDYDDTPASFRTLNHDGAVVFHDYGDKRVIHVVAPKLQGQPNGPNWRTQAEILSDAYAVVIDEFSRRAAQLKLTELRLLPISGGAFAKAFAPKMPEFQAYTLRLVPGKLKETIPDGVAISMCLYSPDEQKRYPAAFKAEKAKPL